MRRYLLLLAIAVIIGIVISIYTINTSNGPMREAMPIEVKVKDIINNPEEYNERRVIVSGIITEIINGHTIYTLWDENMMVELNIPDELKRDLELNTSIKVEGIVRINENDKWIDVERFI